MKKYIFCSLFIFIHSELIAQANSSFLSLEKDFFHEVYALNSQQITHKEAMRVAAIYPEVVKMIKSSRRTELLGKSLVSVGGGGLVAVLVSGAANKSFSLGASLFTAAIFGGGVLVWHKAINKASKAVKLYNLQHATARIVKRGTYLSLETNNTGVGLKFHF